MRVSRRAGLVFLANPKCASNTVERYIHAHVPDTESPDGYIRHAGPVELDQYISTEGLAHDDFIVFTTIRNPWDRMVSLWAYARARPDSLWYEAATTAGSFGNFLRHDIVTVDFVNKFGLDGFTHLPDGRRNVDVVICTERFATDLPLMFRRYGIEFVNTQRRDNPSNRDSYRSYYDDSTRELVARLFAADIEFGNYTF